jgi:hypothetical protein
MFTEVSQVDSGAGSVRFGLVPAATGSVANSPQAASASIASPISGRPGHRLDGDGDDRGL